MKMKSTIAFILLICCLAECRKIVPPLDKNANINFINMEAGGVRAGPNAASSSKTTLNQGGLKPQKLDVQPQKPVSTPIKPPSPTPSHSPVQTPIHTPPQSPVKATPAPLKPQTPIKPIPVNPAPVAHPSSTPGPGSVKQLITYYDSKGQGSPIRPYSYSDAVKRMG